MDKNNFDNCVFYISTKVDGKVIDIDLMQINENGAAAQLYDNQKGDNQKWIIKHVSNDFYKLVCKKSNKCLDIISGGTNNGAQLHQWDNTDVESQLWKIIKVNKDYYKLVSKLSNKVIDATLDRGNGVRLHIWDDLNSETQLFKIEKIKDTSNKKISKTSKSTKISSAKTNKLSGKQTKIQKDINTNQDQPKKNTTAKPISSLAKNTPISTKSGVKKTTTKTTTKTKRK